VRVFKWNDGSKNQHNERGAAQMIDFMAILITASMGICAAFLFIEANHARLRRRGPRRVEQHNRDTYPRVY
jgi:hypothetical protein